MSTFKRLSKETLILIIYYLSTKDLINTATVSKGWLEVVQENLFDRTTISNFDPDDDFTKIILYSSRFPTKATTTMNLVKIAQPTDFNNVKNIWYLLLKRFPNLKNLGLQPEMNKNSAKQLLYALKKLNIKLASIPHPNRFSEYETYNKYYKSMQDSLERVIVCPGASNEFVSSLNQCEQLDYIVFEGVDFKSAVNITQRAQQVSKLKLIYGHQNVSICSSSSATTTHNLNHVVDLKFINFKLEKSCISLQDTFQNVRSLYITTHYIYWRPLDHDSITGFINYITTRDKYTVKVNIQPSDMIINSLPLITTFMGLCGLEMNLVYNLGNGSNQVDLQNEGLVFHINPDLIKPSNIIQLMKKFDAVNNIQLNFDENTKQNTICKIIQYNMDKNLTCGGCSLEVVENEFEFICPNIKMHTLEISCYQNNTIATDNIFIFIKSGQNCCYFMKHEGHIIQVMKEEYEEEREDLNEEALINIKIHIGELKNLVIHGATFHHNINMPEKSITWFQKMYSCCVGEFINDFFHIGLTTSIIERLQKTKALTNDQVQDVLIILKRPIIANTGDNNQELTTNDYWARLSCELEKNIDLKANQVQAVVLALKDEVSAYNVIAMANYTVAQHQGTLGQAGQSNKDDYVAFTASTARDNVIDASATSNNEAHASDAAAYARDAAAASASSQQSDKKGSSFAQYWRKREDEIFKKVGYSKEQLDWVENYLNLTLHDGMGDWHKETITVVVATVKKYLVRIKVQQDPILIRARLWSLVRAMTIWKPSIGRLELKEVGDRLFLEFLNL